MPPKKEMKERKPRSPRSTVVIESSIHVGRHQEIPKKVILPRGRNLLSQLHHHRPFSTEKKAQNLLKKGGGGERKKEPNLVTTLA